MASPKSQGDREVHSTTESQFGNQQPEENGELPSFLTRFLQFGTTKSGNGLNVASSGSQPDAQPWCSSSSSSPDSQSFQPMMVRLLDSNGLWEEFSSVGTEMIIAKSGRLMFPTLKLKLENLHPYHYYKVYLEFAPTDCLRYKFERDSWMPKLTEAVKHPDWVLHPFSPSPGQKWMEKPIDFSVKLTNSYDRISEGMVCLLSMHKYMLKIHVVEGTDTTQRDPLMTRSFPLAKTTFMAVTTYQNPKIKELKTERNVHAKGIRQKKMKLHQSVPEETKENSTECLKRRLLDPHFSHSCLPLVTQNEAFLTASPPQTSPNSTSTPADSTFHKEPECNNRLASIPDYNPYPYGFPPPFDVRIPFSSPLTVHCPTPHYFDPSPYIPFQQPYPFHPSLPSSSVPYFNWPMFSRNCPSLPYSTSDTALRVCPGYRMPFSLQHGDKPANRQGSADSVPSSTSEQERQSTSSEESTWREFAGLRQFVREARLSCGDDSVFSAVSSDCEDSSSPVERL